MSDLTKCNQKDPDCPEPPAYRFTLPGGDEAAICEKHVLKLTSVAACLGLHLQVIPLKPSDLGGRGRGGRNVSGGIHHAITSEFFMPCPFCGNQPNVFMVTDTRYGQEAESWVVECKDMGCIFKRSTPNRSLKALSENWNRRSK